METRRNRRRRRGVALLESALVLPMLVLVMLNVVNFGLYIYVSITLNNAARALVEYRAYTGVVLGFPPYPSVTQMNNMVTSEVSTLPNRGSVSWAVCSNANGAAACEGPGEAFTPASDPVQPTQYTLYSARVSYRFQPLFPTITPLSEGVIYRQVNMRSME